MYNSIYFHETSSNKPILA